VSNDLDLSGPTVTLFGNLDPLGEALTDELTLRGFSTHAVTTSMGWMGSVTRAVIRLDTPAGQQAFADLTSGRDVPSAQVVAVCETTEDAGAAARMDELCRRCGDDHVVSLIWHPSLEPRLGDEGPQLAPGVLAASIADEVENQQGLSAPSYAGRSVEASGDAS
jgi:hypothetical protein